MKPPTRRHTAPRRIIFGQLLRDAMAVASLLGPLVLAGCETGRQNVILGGAAATGYLAQAPSNELEQVYYLGVFDPDEQLPQMMYRVTIRAQASALNQMRYGSGWVPAWAVDSLGSRISAGLDPANADVNFVGGKEDEVRAQLQVGRRLVMFGPDGFREAPKDHRLVIVMGASPEKFFSGIDQAIGAVAGAQLSLLASPIQRDVMAAELAHKQRQIDLAKLGAGSTP